MKLRIVKRFDCDECRVGIVVASLRSVSSQKRGGCPWQVVALLVLGAGLFGAESNGD